MRALNTFGVLGFPLLNSSQTWNSWIAGAHHTSREGSNCLIQITAQRLTRECAPAIIAWKIGNANQCSIHAVSLTQGEIQGNNRCCRLTRALTNIGDVEECEDIESSRRLAREVLRCTGFYESLNPTLKSSSLSAHQHLRNLVRMLGNAASECCNLGRDIEFASTKLKEPTRCPIEQPANFEL